jgi:hypothetical protein
MISPNYFFYRNKHIDHIQQQFLNSKTVKEDYNGYFLNKYEQKKLLFKSTGTTIIKDCLYRQRMKCFAIHWFHCAFFRNYASQF